MCHYQYTQKQYWGEKQITEACVEYDTMYTKHNHMQHNNFIHTLLLKNGSAHGNAKEQTQKNDVWGM